jgi:hypothetical protein
MFGSALWPNVPRFAMPLRKLFPEMWTVFQRY